MSTRLVGDESRVRLSVCVCHRTVEMPVVVTRKHRLLYKRDGCGYSANLRQADDRGNSGSCSRVNSKLKGETKTKNKRNDRTKHTHKRTPQKHTTIANSPRQTTRAVEPRRCQTWRRRSHRMRILSASHPHSSSVLYMALLNGGGPHISTAMSANGCKCQD